MSTRRANRPTLKAIIRLPLLPVMGIAELALFFFCLSCALIRPRAKILSVLLVWVNTLPDLRWYLGMQSNGTVGQNGRAGAVEKCSVGWHSYRAIDGVAWCDKCNLEADLSVCKLAHPLPDKTTTTKEEPRDEFS
jgi:hypothetical protein